MRLRSCHNYKYPISSVLVDAILGRRSGAWSVARRFFSLYALRATPHAPQCFTSAIFLEYIICYILTHSEYIIIPAEPEKIHPAFFSIFSYPNW